MSNTNYATYDDIPLGLTGPQIRLLVKLAEVGAAGTSIKGHEWRSIKLLLQAGLVVKLGFFKHVITERGANELRKHKIFIAVKDLPSVVTELPPPKPRIQITHAEIADRLDAIQAQLWAAAKRCRSGDDLDEICGDIEEYDLALDHLLGQLETFLDDKEAP